MRKDHRMYLLGLWEMQVDHYYVFCILFSVFYDFDLVTCGKIPQGPLSVWRPARFLLFFETRHRAKYLNFWSFRCIDMSVLMHRPGPAA